MCRCCSWVLPAVSAQRLRTVISQRPDFFLGGAPLDLNLFKPNGVYWRYIYPDVNYHVKSTVLAACIPTGGDHDWKAVIFFGITTQGPSWFQMWHFLNYLVVRRELISVWGIFIPDIFLIYSLFNGEPVGAAYWVSQTSNRKLHFFSGVLHDALSVLNGLIHFLHWGDTAQCNMNIGQVLYDRLPH